MLTVNKKEVNYYMPIDTEEWPSWPRHEDRSALAGSSRKAEKVRRFAWSAAVVALVGGLFWTHIAVLKTARIRTADTGAAANRAVER